MLTRREKIKRLLEQAGTEGERAAAAAAYERTRVRRPVPGTCEHRGAMVAHQRMVQHCMLHISDDSLTPAEAATIRRWARYIGRPWEDGAEELRRIHSKLARQDEEQCRAIQ